MRTPAERAYQHCIQRIGQMLVGLSFVLSLGAGGSPARADEPIVRDHRDPSARVQVVVKTVYVSKDGDWHSAGELHLNVQLNECDGDDCITAPHDALVYADIGFSADSGDARTLDRVVPGAGDRLGPGLTVQGGLPLRAGARYGLSFGLWESDTIDLNYDPPPLLHLELSDANGWKIGMHQVATNPYGSATATVVYEIRYAPLPDLKPVAIRVEERGERPLPYICATVENSGTRASQQAQLVLTRDGQVTSTTAVAALGPGESREECEQTGPFSQRVHTLAAAVDGPDHVVEVNETNNEFSSRFINLPAANLPLVDAVSVTTQDPGGAPPGPGLILDPTARGTVPGTSGSKSEAPGSDLVVESISLRGGKNDCDPGKNDVRVKVKNQGAADAADIVVKLVVANSPDVSLEKSLKKLGAGAAEDVDFDDVQIKSGERKLTATVDATSSVSETKDDNNSRSITLSCKDE